MSITNRTWKIVKDEVRDSFRIFRTRLSTRINPLTGKPYTFFLMDGLDWVNVIALTKNNEVVLVKQYRHSAEQYTLEIPVGCVEEGESPKLSALRELAEETGYSGGEIEHLGSLHANPALQAMKLHVFLARDVELIAKPSLDTGEDIEVRLVALTHVQEMIAQGDITHALVVAAFGLLNQKYLQ